MLFPSYCCAIGQRCSVLMIQCVLNHAQQIVRQKGRGKEEINNRTQLLLL